MTNDSTPKFPAGTTHGDFERYLIRMCYWIILHILYDAVQLHFTTR